MSRGYLTRVAKSLIKTPTLEIHIPISPTQTFFNMVRCLTLSLRRFGGAYRDAPVILTIGDTDVDPTIPDRHPWLARLGIESRWVPEADFRQHSYYATGNARFLHDYSSDVVLFLDADILIANSFETMVRDVYTRQVIAGMIAPASPLQFFDNPTTWHDIYRYCKIEEAPDLRHEHPGWPYYFSGDAAYRYCPPYFNYGVICAPAPIMKQLAASYLEDLLLLRAFTNSDLVAQIALTTAIVKRKFGCEMLPVRYNFPNHPMLEALHGAELPHAIFLHLKDDHQIRKSELFADLANVRAATARDDLRGVNQIARRVLLAIEPQLQN